MMKDELMAIVEDALERAGISAGNAEDLKGDVEQLLTAVENYIENYEDYPDDPYEYNGVSRWDFF